jgi:DNA-binding CsgD family transcriptional regulator
MRTVDDILDRISRADEAVFAMDASLRIIRWNKAAEALVGHPARAVLGKPCYEVLRGLDASGNTYCHRDCPVARQARDEGTHPVRPFELSVVAGDGSRAEVSSSLFAVPSYHPALATLVHVFREKATAAAAGTSEVALREPLSPVTTSEGEPALLTNREKDVLACLVKGLTTAAMARRLFISPVTARNHTSSILRKLDVHTKLAAVVFAYQHQMV